MKITSVRQCDLLKQIYKQIKQSGKFDQNLDKVNIISAANGKCKAVFTVLEEHQNFQGSLNEGFSATLVDLITTYALMSVGKHVPGSSVALRVKYLRPAMLGEEVVVDANVFKVGKILAHLEATIKNKSGKIVVTGSHTKYIAS